jgi:hypothetical protein
MKAIILIIFLILIFPFSFIFAQTFSNEKQKFIKQIDELFSDNESEKVKSFAKDEFKENILKNGIIDDGSFNQMVNTSNQIITNGLKPYPNLFNYLYTYNHILSKKLESNQIENWHSIIDNLLETKNKSTDDFIKFSLHFFLYNKISDAGNSNWYYSDGKFFFSMGSNPQISLTNGNLKCLLTDKSSGSGATDSVVISKTNGKLDIISKSWIGSEGKINWLKTGVPSDKMFAEIRNEYKVNLKNSQIKIDSILLSAPYFQKPIYGAIEDKTNTYLREIDRIYPRFVSYNKRVKVENIMNGIDYDGGFVIEGEKLVGSGEKGNLSKVIIKRGNSPFIVVSDELFQFSINSIQSTSSFLKIQIDNDSISHIGINFSYDKNSQEIEISRPSKGIGYAPFEDSYHMLDIFCQRILYRTGTDELRLTYDYGASNDLKNAKFESKNFFDEKLFDSFKGQDAVNPLTNAAKYCREKNIKTLSEGEFASAINKYLSQCKSLMLEMAVHGFINYDTEQKIVTVNEKLYKYVENKSGQGDFDNISFKSDLKPEILQYNEDQLREIRSDSQLNKQYELLLENENRRKSLPFYGVLDLKTKELLIDGVDLVTISNTQTTFIGPENLQIKLKKNRDIQFMGTIYSGKIEIQTPLGFYNYSSNCFEISKSKKAVLYVDPITEREKNMSRIEMVSSFSNLSGKLYVDDISNRSGRNKEFGFYPKLNVSKPCQIFYDKIQNGAYDTSRFFLTIEPFELDSLDNFHEKSLRFNGELTSAGIFPKIKESIKIMDDYSFGFSSKAPESGFPFYGTNTTYKNKIILSGNGLQGAGTINFLNSVSESKGLTFLPDSTIGLANFVNNPSEENIEFPDAYNERAFICYIPKSKILKASSTEGNPIRFYSNEAHLAGTVTIREKGMSAFGELGFKTATMYSKNYQLKRWDILSDTSSFYLKNTYREQGDDPLALKAEGVSANISFKTRKGEFNAAQTKQIEFPPNLYYCQMDKFFWYMDGSTVDMERNKDNLTSFQADASGTISNFYCYDPKFSNQHKIEFKALNAKYDLKSQNIYCEKVAFLPVGGVRVLPDSSKLVIQKKGIIKPLINAVIENENKTHYFEQCYIEVLDKGNYNANGKYRYIDADNEISLIQMDKIEGKNFKTTASGLIEEKRGFKLSKRFEYFGKIEVDANLDSLYCEGSTKVILECKYKKSWFTFKDKISPKNIQIPISSKLIDTDDQPLGIGFYWDKERKNIYTAFLSPLNLPEDELLYSAEGYLQYNSTNNEFQISSKDQLKQRIENIAIGALSTENYLSLDLENNSCNMYGEGEIDLALKLGDASVSSFGSIRYDAVNTKKTTLNLSSRFSFPISQEIMENLAKKIKANEEIKNAKPSEINKTNFDRAMKHWNNSKDYEKIRQSVLDETLPKFPKQLEQTIILSGIELISYNKQDLSGLKSNTSDVLLVSMFEKPVMKNVQFNCFFNQQFEETNLDYFGINFNVSDKFFYFGYEMKKDNGKMSIISNDDVFKKPIKDMKSKQKKIKNFSFDLEEPNELYEQFNKLF